MSIFYDYIGVSVEDKKGPYYIYKFKNSEIIYLILKVNGYMKNVLDEISIKIKRNEIKGGNQAP